MSADRERRCPQISGHLRLDQRLSARDAQASLEMTVALFGAILLLLATLKVFLWVNERIIRRQQNYETTRVGGGQWTEPNQPLRIFQ